MAPGGRHVPSSPFKKVHTSAPMTAVCFYSTVATHGCSYHTAECTYSPLSGATAARHSCRGTQELLRAWKCGSAATARPSDCYRDALQRLHCQGVMACQPGEGLGSFR